MWVGGWFCVFEPIGRVLVVESRRWCRGIMAVTHKGVTRRKGATHARHHPGASRAVAHDPCKPTSAAPVGIGPVARPCGVPFRLSTPHADTLGPRQVETSGVQREIEVIEPGGATARVANVLGDVAAAGLWLCGKW